MAALLVIMALFCIAMYSNIYDFRTIVIRNLGMDRS